MIEPEYVVDALVVIFTLVISSGAAAYVRDSRKQAQKAREMLILILSYYITTECLKYISRGSVSLSEYERLHKGLYEPYIELGGNGVPAHLIFRVGELRGLEGLS